jgi:transcriptional regulator with XRE-family HTH domain
VRRRLVGSALRRYRESVGYTLEDAARVLECDRSKISRIETGQRGIRPKELRELLSEYGVADSEQRVLAAIAGRGGPQAWWQRHAAAMPRACLDYAVMESAASEILTYQAQVIPALLRTDGYAAALAAAEPGYQTDQQREDAVAAAALRSRAVLGGSAGGDRDPDDDPAAAAAPGARRISVVLGEGALRQQVGGPAVMAGQLRHLARLAAGIPAVTIQVLPFSAGAHAAAGGGSLTILRFPGAPGLGVVCLGAPSGGACLDGADAVARHVRAFASLRAAALSPADSARLLRELVPSDSR